MASVALRSCGKVIGRLAHDTRIRAAVAGRTIACGSRIMRVCRSQKSREACMARFARRCGRNVHEWLADDTDVLPAVTICASAGYARVIHPEAAEGGCVVVTRFTGQQRRKMIGRLARYPQGLAVMA